MNRWARGAMLGAMLCGGLLWGVPSGAQGPEVARYLVEGRVHVAVVHRGGHGLISWCDTVSGTRGDVSFEARDAGFLDYGPGHARELPHVAVVFENPPWGGDTTPRVLGVSID